MKVIYVMTNKINKKKYIGQTNNFRLRMNGHHSDANNPNSHSYNYPLSKAIRKYGWENFDNRIIEEIADNESYEFVNERECFFIQYFHSLVSEYGYNITLGGQGCPKRPLTYEERLKKSKIFSSEEIKEIQQLLKQGEKIPIILEKFSPRLSGSFLSNINQGLNFYNSEWVYPLHQYKEDISHFRSISDIKAIKKDIISGMIYKDISAKWNLSMGMISLINNGKQWYEKEYQYPLSIRGNSRSQNAATWVKDVQKDLMSSKLLLTEIAKKYDKAYSTIKKINSGASHKNKEYKYPLTSNRIQ